MPTSGSFRSRTRKDARHPRLQSFTAAAEKLNATQAAISARIATLEQDFGVKLFKRDKRTVALTHAGEELLKYAEDLLGLSARMLQAVSDRGSYEGFISVGVIEAVVHTWLPDLLGRLRQQFPKVRVEIHSYITADLHDELLNGNIDLALAVEALERPTIENNLSFSRRHSRPVASLRPIIQSIL